MLAQMNQAWSDARSYTGNIWQIAALCLTVIALTLNIAYSSESSEILLLLVLLFTALLAAGGVITIQWLRYNITYRVVYIQEIEDKLVELQDEHKVTPSSHLFGLEKGPLAYLFAVLVFTTEILFVSLAYASYSFLIAMNLESLISLSLSATIFVVSFLPFTGFVAHEMRSIRRKEKESAKGWKTRFEENLWKAVNGLREQGHTMKVTYGSPLYEESREPGVNFIIRTKDQEIIFTKRTSYWASKKKWEDVRSFKNQTIFIATPHHERFSEQRNGVFVISSAASTDNLKKYILDRLTEKQLDVKEKPSES
jgi:hypothetical protein